MGVAENAIVWAPHGQNGYAKIFAVEGDGPIDAVRAVPLATGKGIAVAFRRGNSIHVGVAKGEATLTPDGAVAKIAGLGQVGSPTIATSGDAILVAWSDRATGRGSVAGALDEADRRQRARCAEAARAPPKVAPVCRRCRPASRASARVAS